ncbi:MAG: thioredoxin family protein [Bacteroidales bacterium]|nr:thioredoxin family protein [Bacteroidales bacterium]
MKKYFLVLLSIVFVTYIFGQSNPKNLYNPGANAKLDIENAIKLAASGKKHVLIQVGGNWCPWCIRLNQFMKDNEVIDSLLKADYVLLHVNFSKENKNPEVMKMLENPQRFGFPVLVVLDGTGKRLHTQDTGLLEKDKNYDPAKVLRTLKNWNYRALQPIELK